MRFNRAANDKAARYVAESLKIIPPKIKRLVDETGMQIYCFNEKFKPSTIGLLPPSAVFDDGRSADKVSAFYASENTIYLFDEDIYFSVQNDEKAFSTVLHEYGHAVDRAIAIKARSKEWMNSNGDRNVFAGWKKGRALDEYAAINSMEYFAQAFMAYFMDRTGYAPWSYREHTRQELMRRDRNRFDYIRELAG